MDYKYIEQLLERYFDAQTTLQEEHILRAFFAQAEDQMPPQLAQYRPLFAVLNEQPALGDDFDSRLLALTAEPRVVQARTVSMAQRLRPLFRAAAVVAIVLTLSNAINQSFQRHEPQPQADGFAEVATPADDNVPAMAYEGDGSLLTTRTDSLRTDTLALR